MATAQVVLVLIVSVLINSKHVQAQMGPLNLDMLKAEPCPGTTSDLIVMDIVSLDDGLKGLKVTATLPYDSDCSISYQITCDEKKNGQMVNNIFRYDGRCLCEDGKKFMGKFYENLLDSMSMPKTCPTPKGNYNNHDNPYPIREEEISIKQFKIGHFFCRVSFLKMGVQEACASIEFKNNKK